MQILHDLCAIQAAIDSWADAAMRQLLRSRLAFYAEYDDMDLSELLRVILVEPGDTLERLDAEFNGGFLVNHYSGRRCGETGFVPSYETLEAHSSFYDMVFCEGGDLAVEVLIPRSAGIDPRLLHLCESLIKPTPMVPL